MTRGLGDDDPFARRKAATDKFLPPPSSDGPDDGQNINSGSVANVGGEPAPPPPTRESEGRVQMSTRIRVDRMQALKKYQHHHHATFQAVVDQMVDEYLGRRGLLFSNGAQKS